MADDEGYSMIEMVVGMAIMSIAMAVFSTSIFLIYRASAQSEARSYAASQLNGVFAYLDNEVRYASNISTPRQLTPSGNWYVVMQDLTAVPYDPNGETAKCDALQISGTDLQQRNWVTTNGAISKDTGWSTLTSLITNGGAPPGASQPFVLGTVSSTSNALSLTVQLTAASTSGTNTETAQTAESFIALNTNSDSTTGGLCAGGGNGP